MKYSLSVLFVFFYTALSAQQDSLAIVKLVKEDYQTMETINYQRHKDFCTDNYLLIENGLVLTLQDEESWYKSKMNKKIERKDDFTFRYIKINGTTAYSVYDLKSTITEDGVTKKHHWNESAVFKKIDGQWKIELIHSSPYKDSESK